MHDRHTARTILVAAGLLVVASHSAAFSLLTAKWAPGVNTAQSMSGNLGTPGGATWSVMAAGLRIENWETHGGALTTSLAALTSGDETAMISAAINTWAAVCNFTNLGIVYDGGVEGGASQASGGHLGDIRFGAIGGFDASNVLAHAFKPGTEQSGGAGGTILGDLHFNTATTFVDNPNASSSQFDFYTIALHEIGHSLGLDHSTVAGSVMQANYAGARRTLHADDIAGIQTIYGPVPEPATMVLTAAALLAGIRRKRTRAA